MPSPSPAPLWPRLRLPLALLGLMLAHHLAVWAHVAWRRGLPLAEVLSRWDSQHYTTIVLGGHHGPNWAFLPLYPALVRALLHLLPAGAAPALVGSALSTVLLALFVVGVVRAGASAGGRLWPLVPESGWGWFLLLWAPASYSLHSHHTEGLFLLVSGGALLFAARGQALAAGLFAAACVWTRNQGVLVSVCAALLVALAGGGSRAQRAGRFLTLAGLSFAAFLGLLGFQWVMAGDPLAFLHAQQSEGWKRARSLGDVLRALVLANPWQNHHLGSLLRHAYVLVLVGLSLAALRVRWPLGLYGLLSLGLLLLQAEFVNAFRYGGVLFPLAFLAGDRVARLPAWARWGLALALVVLNQWVTRLYALQRWAY